MKNQVRSYLMCLATLISTSPWQAFAGTEGHGGDGCELKLQKIFGDLNYFVSEGKKQNKGPYLLDYKNGKIDAANYIDRMEDQLSRKIVIPSDGALPRTSAGRYLILECSKDPVYVLEGGEAVEKMCKNFDGDKTVAHIQCNRDSFMKADNYDDPEYRAHEDLRYSTLHHELAGLSGIEGTSQYLLSSQITAFRTEKMMSVLALEPQREISPEESHTLLRQVSSNGHLFTRDFTHPELGEAWKDESGLVWGDVVKDQLGSPKSMTEFEALNYCTQIGASLPKKKQLDSLAKYLGNGSTDGYNPIILPHLAGFFFWSSTLDDEFNSANYIFVGSSGDYGAAQKEKNTGSYHFRGELTEFTTRVRCVNNSAVISPPAISHTLSVPVHSFEYQRCYKLRDPYQMGSKDAVGLELTNSCKKQFKSLKVIKEAQWWEGDKDCYKVIFACVEEALAVSE